MKPYGACKARLYAQSCVLVFLLCGKVYVELWIMMDGDNGNLRDVD